MFEAIIPADRTKGGRDEPVEFALSWEVVATRPMRDSDWIQWEIERARETLERAERALDDETMFSVRDADTLSSSLHHAKRAWCRVRLGRAGSNDFDTDGAFQDNAPQSLVGLMLKACSSLHHLRWLSTVSPSKATADVREAVDAMLDAPHMPAGQRLILPASGSA